MSLLKFSPGHGSDFKATVAIGRYVIVDYGREGWDATFIPSTGAEVGVPPASGGRFHAGSRRAMSACEDHYRRLGLAGGLTPGSGTAAPL